LRIARLVHLLPIFAVSALVACGSDSTTSTPPTDTGGEFLEPETGRPDDGPVIDTAVAADTAKDAPADSLVDSSADSASDAPTDTGPSCSAGAKIVSVGEGGLTFSPSTLSVKVGDTVCWQWKAGGHTVTSGSSCTADGKFCSPSDTSCSTATTSLVGAIYEHKFTAAGSFPYYCAPHCSAGMVGTITVTP
jgi:plastocyanin